MILRRLFEDQIAMPDSSQGPSARVDSDASLGATKMTLNSAKGV